MTDEHRQPHVPGEDAEGRRRVPDYGNQRSEWNAGTRFDVANPEYR